MMIWNLWLSIGVVCIAAQYSVDDEDGLLTGYQLYFADNNLSHTVEHVSNDTNSQTKHVPKKRYPRHKLRDTYDPCRALRDQLLPDGWDTKRLVAGADEAMACMEAIPLDPNSAVQTVESVRRMVQFHSTLDYLKSTGLGDGPIDIDVDLHNLEVDVYLGHVERQYKFEDRLAGILDQAKDYHLVFTGNLFRKAIFWQRSTDQNLVCLTLDGGLPRIYLEQDVSQDFTPSPVNDINGVDPVVFLSKEIESLPWDADAAWNYIFAWAPKDYGNRFIQMRRYREKWTNITLLNGSRVDNENYGFFVDPKVWLDVTDVSSVYEKFVKWRSPVSQPVKPRQETQSHCLRPRDLTRLQQVMAFGKKTRGYIDSANKLAILQLGSFDEGTSKAVEDFLHRYCRGGKTEQIIIDLSNNLGGHWDEVRAIFTLFFPNAKPYNGVRIRAHPAADMLGSAWARNNVKANYYGCAWQYDLYLDRHGSKITSWQQLYGDHHDTSTSATAGGYSSVFRVPPPADAREPDPFKASSIVIMSNGKSGSGSAIFSNNMLYDTPQGFDIKTVVLGGFPQRTPMSLHGGTKGGFAYESKVLFHEMRLAYLADRNSLDFEKVMPFPPPIQVDKAAVNLLDVMRRTSPSSSSGEELPSQFLTLLAKCRIFYNLEMWQSREAVWEEVRRAAFGGPGGEWDRSRCVAYDQPSSGEGDVG